MDGKTLVRIGAVMFVAIAITATIIDMTRKDDAPVETAEPPALHSQDNAPLDTELTRCSQAGEAATRDPSCLHAWDRSRRRFLGEPQEGR